MGALQRIASTFRVPVTAECGHKTRRKGKISAFGETTVTKMPFNEAGGFDYCLDCVTSMAIRCAWCGKAIFIGDPVTLYSPLPPYDIPEYAVKYPEEPLRLVGCLRWECADTGAAHSGFWVPGEDGEGTVYRIQSMLEMLFSDPDIVMITQHGGERPTVTRRQPV